MLHQHLMLAVKVTNLVVVDLMQLFDGKLCRGLCLILLRDVKMMWLYKVESSHALSESCITLSIKL